MKAFIPNHIGTYCYLQSYTILTKQTPIKRLLKFLKVQKYVILSTKLKALETAN
jgi:hypothetical protein